MSTLATQVRDLERENERLRNSLAKFDYNKSSYTLITVIFKTLDGFVKYEKMRMGDVRDEIKLPVFNRTVFCRLLHSPPRRITYHRTFVRDRGQDSTLNGILTSVIYNEVE